MDKIFFKPPYFHISVHYFLLENVNQVSLHILTLQQFYGVEYYILLFFHVFVLNRVGSEDKFETRIEISSCFNVCKVQIIFSSKLLCTKRNKKMKYDLELANKLSTTTIFCQFSKKPIKRMLRYDEP